MVSRPRHSTRQTLITRRRITVRLILEKTERDSNDRQTERKGRERKRLITQTMPKELDAQLGLCYNGSKLRTLITQIMPKEQNTQLAGLLT